MKMFVQDGLPPIIIMPQLLAAKVCAAGVLFCGEEGLQLLQTRDWMHWTFRSFSLQSAALMSWLELCSEKLDL